MQVALQMGGSGIGYKTHCEHFWRLPKKKSETFACERSHDFFTKNAKTCVLVHNAA